MPHEALALDRPPAAEGAQPRSDFRLTALSIVFVVSGFCGLIYESLWSHYLKLFVGHAAYAQTVVLIVFIGGMALGAWLVGRIASRIANPLLVYAAVEGAIGAVSLVFHSGFVGITEWGYATLLPAACVPESPCVAQWLLAAAMILPQSVLLGTTFPLMTAGILRIAPSNPGSRISLFYFLNSIGAVAGVLSAAFVLIPAFGLPGALFTAGLLNIGVALAAYACSKGELPAPLSFATDASAAATDTPSFRRLLLLVAALTGLSSFVYEIIWIRMLSLVIGASTDAFELMLAAFILGLALGGLWIRKRIDRFTNLLASLAVVQILMGIAAVATLPLYDRTFDFLAWLLRSLSRTDNAYLLYNLATHGIALLVMLPATFLAGMTLPLITTALLRGRQGEGAIGFVYAANTVGAIIGVILTVHFAMPMLGLKGGLLLGAGIDIALALLLFAYNRDGMPRRQAVGWGVAGVAALIVVASVVPVTLERMASGVYRYGIATLTDDVKVIFHRDGKTANVDVLQSPVAISIRTNGKSDAGISVDQGNPIGDEHTMAFAAILPLALRPNAEYAAVIGFGSGMTTATLLDSPRIKRVDTIEIEPEMVNGARLFGAPVERAYTDARSRIVIDDAKSYFARSPLRYDLIVSEPSNPWVSGVASLFTAEFYRRTKRQLTDDGLFVQWIQAYEFSNRLMSTILRAIDAEFVDYAVYAANESDLIIVASNRRLPPISEDFTRFPDLKKRLGPLGMSTVGEIDVRRLAGRPVVRAMFTPSERGVNSDYYPLVDLGAPRERFLGSQARGLLDLHRAPVPVVDMVESAAPVAPDSIAAVAASHERRSFVKSARATASWLATGNGSDERSPPLPSDIGLLRGAFWHCAQLPPRVSVREMAYSVATIANPHLPSAEATRMWAGLRAAPCADRATTPADRPWLDLYAAVAAREAESMARLGAQLAGPDTKSDGLRAYALMAAVTGLVSQKQHDRARSLLDTHLAKLPANLQNQPAMVVLKGMAAAR